MTDKADMGEQVLSKVVEMGLSSQLDEVENLAVDIRTDPFKLMQGQLESVEIVGEGLVMQKDLRTEELQVQVDSVAINPMKAAFGQIELTHPTNASASVTLTEEDIERAFNADFIQEKLQNLQVHINNQLTTINTRHVDFKLPGEGKIALGADVSVVGSNDSQQVAFTAVPQVEPDGYRVALKDVEYAEGKQVSPELTDALIESASQLLDLRNFNLEGMSLRLKQLDIQVGRLTLEAEAYVEQFPSSK